MCFALFAETVRGYRGSKVIRRQHGKDCLVELDMETAAGEDFFIGRPQNHKKHPKPWCVIAGETRYGAEAVAETVANVLGVGFDAFVSALVFGKGKTKCFTQLTDAERKAVLEEILALKEIAKFAEIVKAELQVLESATRTCEGELRVVRERQAALERSIADLGQQAAEFASAKKARVRAAEERLKDAREAVRKATLEASVAEAALAKTTAELGRLEPLEQQFREEEALLAKAATAKLRDHMRALGTLDPLKQQLERLQELGAECLECLQPIDAGHRERCSQELQQKCTAVEADILTLAGEHKTFEDGLSTLRQSYTRQVGEPLKRLRQQKDQDTFALRRAQNAVQAAKITETTELALLESAKAETSTAADTIAARTKDREAAIAKATELSGLLAQFLDRRLYADWWLRGFSNAGMKSELMDGAMPGLDQSAAHYSQLLTDGVVPVVFDTRSMLKSGEMREKFDVRVDIPDGAGDFDGASSGEQGLINVIATLALGDLAVSRVGQPLNIAILDEVFDSLDEVWIERTIHLLMRLAEERESVFVITHTKELSQHFPRVVTVEKQDGASKVAA